VIALLHGPNLRNLQPEYVACDVDDWPGECVIHDYSEQMFLLLYGMDTLKSNLLFYARQKSGLILRLYLNQGVDGSATEILKIANESQIVSGMR